MCTLHLSEPLFNMPCAKCNAMLKLHLRNTGSPFAICNVLYRLMCNVHLLSGQSAVSSMSTWLRDFESCNAMLNVPSQISRHICCRLRLSITCCALHNVQGSLRLCKCASPVCLDTLPCFVFFLHRLKALESSHVTQKHICESSLLTWTHIWRLPILLTQIYPPTVLQNSNQLPLENRGSAVDGGLCEEGAGVSHLHGGDDAPSQDLAVQGGIFCSGIWIEVFSRWDLQESGSALLSWPNLFEM